MHTEKILADRKVFFLDLKSNARGMVVKITEDVGGNRDTIMVPAEILGDFIAALKNPQDLAAMRFVEALAMNDVPLVAAIESIS